MDAVKLVYRPLTTRAARRALVGRLRSPSSAESGRFTRKDVRRLLASAWTGYDEAVGSLAPQPTVGSGMNVRLACFTFSFFESLVHEEVERSYAIELVADATWQVYQTWARLASAAGRLAHGQSTALAFAVVEETNGKAKVHLRFPFNAPGYVIEPAPVDQGSGFNVVHCPVATYFRAHDAADLCVASWCNLDFALSEMTNQTLVRTKTLVQGGSHCDFRISARQP